MPDKHSDETRHKAATCLAVGKSIAKTAVICGVDEKTVDRWKQRPEFLAMIQAEAKLQRERIIQEGLAVKETRILAKRRRHHAIMRGLRARAKHPTRGGVDWDDSGLFIQRLRVIGSGDIQREVTEYELDTGTLASLNDLEDGIAREKGDHKISIEIPREKEPEDLIALSDLLSDEEIQDLLRRALERAKKPDVGPK